MRAFLAVPCGEQLARAVTTVLDGWRSGPGGRLPVRWTSPETWHLTLQFLGDWPETRLKELGKALSVLPYPEPFALTPGRLGGFPDLQTPRVLFLHMDDGGQTAHLAQMVRETTAECWPEGPQDTRAFRPHLTLGRVTGRLSGNEPNLLQELEFAELPEVFVEGFSLMGSELRRSRARHTELGFLSLRK